MQEIPDLTSHFVVPVQPIFQSVIGDPIRTTTVTIAVQIDSGLHKGCTPVFDGPSEPTRLQHMKLRCVSLANCHVCGRHSDVSSGLARFQINNRDYPRHCKFQHGNHIPIRPRVLGSRSPNWFLGSGSFDFLGSIQIGPGQVVKYQKETSSHFIFTRAQKPLRSKLTMTDQELEVKVAFMAARLGQTTKNKTDKNLTVFPEAKTALEDRNFCSSTSSHLHTWCECVCARHSIIPRSRGASDCREGPCAPSSPV